MDLALFALRIAVGLFFAGHGAQKLWGWFGGHGLEGTGQFFESLGIRPGRQNAQIAGTSEFLGGILLALGLLTPLAAILIISVMTVAIITVHGKNGPWVTEQGYEYNVVLIAAAFVIAAGPGTWSVDAALGVDGLHGTLMAIVALAVGVAAGFGAVIQGRRGIVEALNTPLEPDDVERDERFAREEAGTHEGPRMAGPFASGR